jgi:3-dehydroquinate dehydratase-1
MNTGAVTPQVVGTIHSPLALRHALRLKPGAIDLLEVRVDHFAADPAVLQRTLPRLAFPLIVTVRHSKEGGSGNLSRSARERLFAEFLPHAAWIDLELRSAAAMQGVAQAARARQVGVILSHHYFTKTPTLAALASKLREARAFKADVFKVAARTSTAADVSRLLAVFAAAGPQPVSVMGMGPLGKASRLLFAQAGSRLNYGYLGEPQVSGQWPAELLKKRLQELTAQE